MKKIVSVSLGSSRRDHRVETEFGGEQFTIERIGTDGDPKRAMELMRLFDGKVDAIGLGGIDLYLFAGAKRYVVQDAARIARVVRSTPVVDGSGLKNTLERRVVRYLSEQLQLDLKNKRVLMVSGVDRFGMAEAFDQAGSQLVFGDIIFALGMPIAITQLGQLQRIAGILLPVFTRLPFQLLYPTGSKQDQVTPKHQKYYQQADIIAGDFLYIKKYLPERVNGKIIVTNTVTAEDVDDLKQRGVSLLITSTPEFNGRSFGTNVMEALLVAFSGKRPDMLGEADYLSLLDRMQFQPRVVRLNEA